ncbi:hypothetical protein PsorP6_002609 [Peronosclerospora sorghi]|uniref:Uncharacterized protein n=1 Tax=Peronosclerospora sorghi TaxID=230839 RepID=A0ACC0WVD2_9STRA|nr:hypothetical protein PsorP6_002609 [Peronosclerospora sorghi]
MLTEVTCNPTEDGIETDEALEKRSEREQEEEYASPSENEDTRFFANNDDTPTKVTRYYLRQRRPAATSHNSMTTRSRAKRSAVPVFEDTSRRYALRDRSKHIDRTSTSRGMGRSRPARVLQRNRAAGTTRRLFLPDRTLSPSSRRRHRNYRPRDRTRRCHLPSSSSSSSASSSTFDSDDGSSDGGMRTSCPWRASKAASSRKTGHSRADITPIEVDGTITWDSVGGLESHIEALKEMVTLPLLYPEFYDKYNVAPPSVVLFYGPPDTGKTLLAPALANSCSVREWNEQHGRASTGTKRCRRRVTFYMRLSE